MKKLGVLLVGLVLAIGAPFTASAVQAAVPGDYTITLDGNGPHALPVNGNGKAVAGWGTAIPMYCYVWGGPQLRITSFYVPRAEITKAGRARVQWGNKFTTDDTVPPGAAQSATAGRVDLRFSGAGGRKVSGTIDLRVGNCYRTGLKVAGSASGPVAKGALIASKRAAVKGRTTRLRVHCPRKPAGPCTGKLLVRHKKKVLAQRKYAVKAGRTKAFKVRLTKRGKRILSRQKPRRVTVVLNPGKGVANVAKWVRIR